MMNRKVKIGLSVTGVMLSVLGLTIALISNPWAGGLRVPRNAERSGLYSLTFSGSENHATEFASKAGTLNVVTSSGNPLRFTYEEAEAYAGGFITLDSGGTFLNPYIEEDEAIHWHNALNGLSRISVSYLGGSLSVSYGMAAEAAGGGFARSGTLQNGTYYTFEAPYPSYFVISNSGGAANIASITVSYSCLPPTEGEVTVDLTGFNDFHAAIDEANGNVGLAKFASYLKKRKSEGSIIVNSGDMWKGEFADSYTHGGLVSRCFANVGVDVTTIGNHEFDWGAEWITRNEGPDYLNDKMLGANIYQYPKGPGGWVKSDLGVPYKVVVKNEGRPDEVRVGFVGVIGVDQITSITSTAAWDYIFLSTEDAIKENSRILRRDERCDLVIASYHNGGYDQGILGVDPVTGKHYVDGIFLGHTHALMEGIDQGVPYLQSKCFGSHVGEMSFKVDLATRNAEVVSYENFQLNAGNLQADAEVKSLIDAVEKGPEGTEKITGEKLGRAKDNMDNKAMARYFAKQSARKVAEKHAIDICMFNGARASLGKGDVTYGDLFRTNPFENELYIIDITGKNLFDEAGYSCFYRVRNASFANSSTARYKVLVYNYNGLHIKLSGEKKIYDYFPTLADPGAVPPQKIEDLPDLRMNAVDIAAWYMRNGENVISKNDYETSNARFDSAQLTNAIS